MKKRPGINAWESDRTIVRFPDPAVEVVDERFRSEQSAAQCHMLDPEDVHLQSFLPARSQPNRELLRSRCAPWPNRSPRPLKGRRDKKSARQEKRDFREEQNILHIAKVNNKDY